MIMLSIRKIEKWTNKQTFIFEIHISSFEHNKLLN